MGNVELVRPYRGVSAADRLALRRARLHESCLDVVGTGGVADVTVARVCAGAGLIKRYFYESFSDVDALLDDVLAEFLSEFHDELTAALAASPATARDRAYTSARILIEFLERDRRRARLYVESPGNPVLGARLDRAYAIFSSLALETFPGPHSPGREVAALIVVAGTTQAAIAWSRGRLALDHDQIIAEIANVIENAFGIP